MQKRTSYEFEGKVGYTYVTKAYGNSDVRFETHFRVSESEVDTIQFGVDCGTARSMLRSLTRAVIEADKDLELSAIPTKFFRLSTQNYVISDTKFYENLDETHRCRQI